MAAEGACSPFAAFPSYCPGQLLRESLLTFRIAPPPGLEDVSPAAMLHANSATSECSENAFELQSFGSKGHEQGLCRPCGFVHHKDGCAAGVNCSFCHLCPPGTIERQRKLKRSSARAARRNRPCQCSPNSSPRNASPTYDSATSRDRDDDSQCSTVDTQSARAESPRIIEVQAH